MRVYEVKSGLEVQVIQAHKSSITALSIASRAPQLVCVCGGGGGGGGAWASLLGTEAMGGLWFQRSVCVSPEQWSFGQVRRNAWCGFFS